MPYATSDDGIKLYYESDGEGPAVVFLHGGNGNTLSWVFQIPHFRKNYRCIAVDLRTYKHSKCPVGQYHVLRFAGDLLAVLDHAGVDRAALVCQSLGAFAGLPFAVKYPQRVSALFINGSPTPAYSPENWELLEKSYRIVMATRRGEVPVANATGISPRFMAEQPALTFLYESLTRLNGERRTTTMSEEEVKLYPKHFEGYRTPTLIAGGVHDNFLTPTHHLHIAGLVPGATTHTFQDSGHSAYWEEPAEFNRVLETFLKQHGWG